MKEVGATKEQLIDELLSLCRQINDIRDSETGAIPPEAAQSISHQLCLDIIEFLPDATFAIDREKRVIAWNRAIEEMTGVKKEDILGRGNHAYSIPFYGEPRPIVIDLVLGADSAFEQAYHFVEKEGEVCFAEVFAPKMYDGKGAYLWGKASPLYDDCGNLIGAIESIRDITERILAEQKLRESEEKYKMIFENSPLGIFHFDLDGVVTACNENIVDVWGSTKEKFIGFNLLASMKNKKMKAAVSACLCGRTACYEGNYLSVTGGKISNLKAVYGPIFSREGAVLGGIGVIEDISERKQAEEKLCESEQRLRALSSQLLVTQEQERKRIARELHDSIGSSLGTIKSRLEDALARSRKGAPIRTMLHDLISMAENAIEESRRIMTELRPSMLDDLGIVTTIAWFCVQFQKVYTGIYIEEQVEVKEEDIPDPLKIVIFRIIQETLHNTAKYSGANLVNLSLLKTMDSIELIVQDNGIGFDPEAVLSTSTRDKTLGLPGMRERVELSGGTFAVNSAQGMGTTVNAVWPLEAVGYRPAQNKVSTG